MTREKVSRVSVEETKLSIRHYLGKIIILFRALLSDLSITSSLVSDLISKLDSDKQWGDCIPGVILKKCTPELTQFSPNSTTVAPLLPAFQLVGSPPP